MMRADQCGTGRNLQSLHPGDRAEVEAFRSWLESGAPAHLRAVRHLMTNGAPLQLTAGLPFHAYEAAQVVDAVGADRQTADETTTRTENPL